MNGAARPFLPGWPAPSQLDLFHDQTDPGARFTQGVGATHPGLLGFSHPPHPYSVPQSMLPSLSTSGDALHKVNEYLSHRPTSYASPGLDGFGAYAASFNHGPFEYNTQKPAFGQVQNPPSQHKVDHAETVSRGGSYMHQNIAKDLHSAMKEHSAELKVNGHPALPSAATLIHRSQQSTTFQNHGIDRFISNVTEGNRNAAHSGLLHPDEQSLHHSKAVPSHPAHFVHTSQADLSAGFENYTFPRHPVNKAATSYAMPVSSSISTEFSPMLSTSASSTMAASKQSVISYYSKSNEPEMPSLANNYVGADRYPAKENAIKVAEKIIQEANCSMKPGEKRPSSSASNPYKNERQPFQQANGMWHNITFSHPQSGKTDYSIDKLSQGDNPQKNALSQKQQSLSSSRPSSVKSGHSLEMKSPVDFRPENFPQNWNNGHQSRPGSSKSSHSLDLKSPVDFGSDQFVQNWHQLHFNPGHMAYQNPGRNASLDFKPPSESQEHSSTTESGQAPGFSTGPPGGSLTQTGLPPPYEAPHQKVQVVKKSGNQSSTGSTKKTGEGVKKNAEGSKKKSSKKAPDVLDYSTLVNKPAKRGSTMIPSDNPIINNLVDEKVQQIMAAYRQKELSSSQENLKQDIPLNNDAEEQGNSEHLLNQLNDIQQKEPFTKELDPVSNTAVRAQTSTPLMEQDSKTAENLSSQILNMRQKKIDEHQISQQESQQFPSNPPSYQDSMMMRSNQQVNAHYAFPYQMQNNEVKVESGKSMPSAETAKPKICSEGPKWENDHKPLTSNELLPNCCNVCETLGQYSQNCQNHKHPVQTKEMHKHTPDFHNGSRLLHPGKHEFSNKDSFQAPALQFRGQHPAEHLQDGIKQPQSDPFAFTDENADKSQLWPRKKHIPSDYRMRKQEFLYDKKPFAAMNGEDKMHFNGSKPFMPAAMNGEDKMHFHNGSKPFMPATMNGEDKMHFHNGSKPFMPAAMNGEDRMHFHNGSKPLMPAAMNGGDKMHFHNGSKPFMPAAMNGEDRMHFHNGSKPFMPKKLNMKPIGMKPTLPFFKKSFKYHTQKLKPFKKKIVPAVPNGKVKKQTAKSVRSDDAEFAAKLMKNLGFLPLTRKELVTKKSIKIPGHHTKGPATIASSVLSTETKGERRDGVPSAEISLPSSTNSDIQSLKSTQVTNTAVVNSSTNSSTSPSMSAQNSMPSSKMMKDCSKHQSRKEIMEQFSRYQMRRSRSTEELFTCDFEKVRKRSRSFSLPRREQIICTCKVKEEVPEPSQDMSNLTSQIDSLRTMVTGDNKDCLANNSVVEAPNCGCLGPNVLSQESIEGPYYTHLGAGRSVEAIRKILEGRTGVKGAAIRIEKVRYTGKEGKSSQGCPIAKWIIRRSCLDEKYLAVVRHRQGHFCETAWLIIGLVAWEGVQAEQANELYDFLCNTLPKAGFETERRCGTNDRKTCACQGADLAKRGASFSFGCSWSMYFNGCKFARSQVARKFKLKDTAAEPVLESRLTKLASQVGPLYGKCAPDAHNNQCFYSKGATDCRLDGTGPFSGVTACVDFCAHAHKDIHNMNNGSTVVVTLTKHRGLSKPDDEQLHVLPLYVLDPTDERGSYEGQYEKIKKGALEVLHHYPLEARMRSHPLTPCKKRRELARKARKLNGINSRPSSTSSAQSTPKKQKADLPYAQMAEPQRPSYPQYGRSENSAPADKQQPHHPVQPHHESMSTERPVSYEELMSFSSHSGFSAMYDRYWEYFYANGVFPSSTVLNGSFKNQKSVKSFNDEPVQCKGVETQEKRSHQRSEIAPVQQLSDQQQREQLIEQRQQQLQMHKWQQQPHQPQRQDLHKSYQQGPTHNQKQDQWYLQQQQQQHQQQLHQQQQQKQRQMQQHQQQLQQQQQQQKHQELQQQQQQQQLQQQQGLQQQHQLQQQQSSSHGMLERQSPLSQHVQFRSQSVPLEQSKMAAKATEQIPQTDSMSQPTSACVQGPSNYQSSWSQIPQHHPTGNGSTGSTADNIQSRNSLSLAASSSPQSSAMDLSRPSSSCSNSTSTPFTSGTNCAPASSVLSRPHSTSSNSVQLNLHANTQDSVIATENPMLGKTPLDMLSQVIEKRSMDMGFSSNLCDNMPGQPSQSQFVNNFSLSQASKVGSKTNMPQSDFHLDQVRGQGQNHPSDTGSSIQGQSHLSQISSQHNKESNQTLSNSVNFNFPHVSSENSNNKNSQPGAARNSQNEAMNLSAPYQSVGDKRDTVSHNTSFDQTGNGLHTHKTTENLPLNKSSVNNYEHQNTGYSSHQNQKTADVNTEQKVKSFGHNIHPAFGRAFHDANHLHHPPANTSPHNAQASHNQQYPHFSSQEQRLMSQLAAHAVKSEPSTSHQTELPHSTLQTTGHLPQNSHAQNTVSNNQLPLNEQHQGSQNVQNSPFSLHSQIQEQRLARSNMEEKYQDVLSGHEKSHQQFQDSSVSQLQDQGRITPQNQIPKPNMPQHHHQNSHTPPNQHPQGQHYQQDNIGRNAYPNPVHPNASRFCFYDQFRKKDDSGSTPTKPDPDVIKCEMEYNEDAFRDPDIGGVAISLSHGAVLFEVAKRELHATTGLRNPNRYHPTRISLVFYQHKNLNRERHGMYAYAKKLEDMKQARIDKMQAEQGYVDMTAIENSFRGGKKRKVEGDNEEVIDEEKLYKEYVSATALDYRYLWDCNAKRHDSFTTNSVSMKWINPQPMVTGPYQKWI